MRYFHIYIYIYKYLHEIYIIFFIFIGSSPTRHPVSRTTETTEERITQVPESPKEKVQKPLLYET